MCITSLTVQFVLFKIVDEGLTRRHVAETAMNAESSRSHAILTLTVKTTSSSGGITVHKHSRLNLVDLAGSERQKDAMSSGERLKVLKCHFVGFNLIKFDW